MSSSGSGDDDDDDDDDRYPNRRSPGYPRGGSGGNDPPGKGSFFQGEIHHQVTIPVMEMATGD